MNQLLHMYKLEIAADGWWDDLSADEKKAYKRAHPNSKFSDGPLSIDHRGKSYFKTGKRGTRIKDRKPTEEYRHYKDGIDTRAWRTLDGEIDPE